MKNFSSLIFVFLFSLFGCASKADVSSQGPDAGFEATEQGTPPPATPTLPKGGHVTLVLGGSGVASFATIGLLKKLNEEGVEIDLIVATGLPALFALANGFLKTVHDLEWFATRLSQRDLEKLGSSDFRKEIDPEDNLPTFILKSFPQKLLNQSRVPVVIAATNTDVGEADVYGSGEWKEPLLKTVSIPGLHRKFVADRGTAWVEGVQGLDVREAVRRGSQIIIAVSMHDDFIQSLNKAKGEKEDELFRRLYASQLRKTTTESLKLAGLSSSITLQKDPLDLSAKRAAILAGYREGSRIVKKLREPASPSTN